MWNETIAVGKGHLYATTSIVDGDTTTLQSLIPAGNTKTNDLDEDLKVIGIIISSTDTAARDVQFSINDGTNENPLHTVNVAAKAGTDGSTDAADGLAALNQPTDAAGNIYLSVPKNHILKVKALVAGTNTKQIDVTVIMEKFTQ